MKERTYYLNTILAAVLGVALLVCVVVRTFLPNAILPRLDICNMVALSLIALLTEYYLVPGGKRCYLCIPAFAALTFGLLPFCGAFVTAAEALKLGVLGGAVFTAVTWLFTSMVDRLSTGPAAKLAPLMGALGLYLASQCFLGM